MWMARSTMFSNHVFKLPLALVAILTALLCFFGTTTNLAFAQSTTSSPPMIVYTDNNSVRVIVNWSPAEIQPGQNVDLSLEFQSAKAVGDLSHVNYDFEVIDSSGKVIKSVEGVHTHTGIDVQTVKFDNVGDFKLEITVIGLGLSQPFDTSKSGTAQSSIMVVPEFPFALPMLAAAGVIVVLLSRTTHIFGLSKSSAAKMD